MELKKTMIYSRGELLSEIGEPHIYYITVGRGFKTITSYVNLCVCLIFYFTWTL